MPNVLAFLSSVGWGCSDFLGGFASKRLPAWVVAAVSQTAGFLGLALALLVVDSRPNGRDWALGVLAALLAVVGITFLYRALAAGPMNVAAPTAAVVGSGTAVIAGIAFGERPGMLAVLGIAAAVVAILAVSKTPDAATDDREPGHVRRTLVTAAIAGVTLGGANVCFSRTSIESGISVVVIERAIAAAILAVPAWRVRPPRRDLPRADLGFAVGAGLLDAAAATSLLLALQRGGLVLGGMLSGLFPVVTVVLARVVLGERMGRPQLVGLAFGVAAVALLGLA